MRQRIVINVDGPPDEATKRVRTRSKGRRWVRVLGILAVLVLVVVVVAVVGGYTPADDPGHFQSAFRRKDYDRDQYCVHVGPNWGGSLDYRLRPQKAASACSI